MAEIVQRELIKMFQSIGSIPDNLLMNRKTAQLISPLTKRLRFAVQTDNYVSIAKMAIEEMENSLPF
ncbi:hypothetical protein QA612_15255 [Evansella sp. AB-P1]|uniref:hypothetical protein n=1 Tax=Evansella sp. AB-P1 TaxID=3037653 RepID=UPI00241DF9CE|nr:hypothetical protein [Evansella sp. AB-P1]MDG5788828.1 hypothetical protein [Evansella sp. AB-P1]